MIMYMYDLILSNFTKVCFKKHEARGKKCVCVCVCVCVYMCVI